MKTTREILRAWLEIDGIRVCRDITLKNGAIQPTHLAVMSLTQGPIWEWHEEGAWVPTIRVEP